MDVRRRILSGEYASVLVGDEGCEAQRAHIPDDALHIVTMRLDLASAIDPAVLLRDGVMTIYVFGDGSGPSGARDHATVKLRNDTVTIELLDDSWLAMPACELFEDLGAVLPDHAKRALESVQDAEVERQMLDDNLCYPPFREQHARELEALIERRRQLPANITRRMRHWEHVERGVVEPRVWPTRRRGEPVLVEHVFAQLGELKVIVRCEEKWREPAPGGYSFAGDWITTSRLVLGDGRELIVRGEYSGDDFMGTPSEVEHLGGARYRVRGSDGSTAREFVFDLDVPSVTYVS